MGTSPSGTPPISSTQLFEVTAIKNSLAIGELSGFNFKNGTPPYNAFVIKGSAGIINCTATGPNVCDWKYEAKDYGFSRIEFIDANGQRAQVAIAVPNTNDIITGSLGDFVCRIQDATRAVYCWGNNNGGTLGQGTCRRDFNSSMSTHTGPNPLAIDRGALSSTPVPAENIPKKVLTLDSGVSQIAVGGGYQTYCWGPNESGTLGRGLYSLFEWSPMLTQ